MRERALLLRGVKSGSGISEILSLRVADVVEAGNLVDRGPSNGRLREPRGSSTIGIYKTKFVGRIFRSSARQSWAPSSRIARNRSRVLRRSKRLCSSIELPTSGFSRPDMSGCSAAAKNRVAPVVTLS